jgi:hypothetical protein
MFSVMLDGKLFLAPIGNNPQKVLVWPSKYNMDLRKKITKLGPGDWYWDLGDVKVR